MGISPLSPEPQYEAGPVPGQSAPAGASGPALAALVFSILATAAAAFGAYAAWGAAVAGRQALTEIETVRRELQESVQQTAQAVASVDELRRSLDALGSRVDRVLQRLAEAPSGSGSEIRPRLAEGAEAGEAMPTMYILVRRGDTLWELARAFLGDATRYRELARRNGLERPEQLREGMLLALP